MILRSRNPFSLRDLAFSHGWIALPPWSWQPNPPALRRIERLPSGVIASLQITSADPDAPADEFSVSATEEAGHQVLGSSTGPTVEGLPECGQGPLREPLGTRSPAVEADLVRTPASPPALGAGPGSALSGHLRGPDPHCPRSAGQSAADHATLERRVRWMLRLDEDFTEFHTLLRSLPGCERPAARGEGRLLRSWDFLEDATKT